MTRSSILITAALAMCLADTRAADQAPGAARKGWINAADAGGLQAALDALPETGGTVFLPAGRYVVNKPIVKRLAEGQHLFLVGEGRASVLVNENRKGAELLHLVGAVGKWWPDLKITIRDLTLVGNHASGDALVVEYPNDTMVDGCFFEGHGGKALYLKVQGTNVTCRDCWMRDCKRGVYAENIHHLTLHGVQTRSLKEGQVQAEHVYLDRNCREVRVVNNHFAYGQAEAIILDGTAQHVIVGNTIEGFATGILARADKERDCRDITIGSNYIHFGCAIRLETRCNGFVISNNIITDASDGALVVRDAQGSGAHSISGNVLRKSVYKGQGGVDLGDSLGCNVVGNVFEEVLTTPAIAAGPGGGKHLISSNNITKSGGPQIVVKDAPDCLVSGNRVGAATSGASAVPDGEANRPGRNPLSAAGPKSPPSTSRRHVERGRAAMDVPLRMLFAPRGVVEHHGSVAGPLHAAGIAAMIDEQLDRYHR